MNETAAEETITEPARLLPNHDVAAKYLETQRETVDKIIKASVPQRSSAKSVVLRPAAPAGLFKSVRAALAFAYSICDHSIAPSCNLLPPTGGGNSRMADFSPHEKHAQGALIRRVVEQRLKGIDLALTLAYYGTGKARAAAIRKVCREVAKRVRKTGLGEELAKRHFSRNGERHSQAHLAALFNLSQQTVSRLDREVADEIDRLRKLSEKRLEDLFVRTGVADAL